MGCFADNVVNVFCWTGYVSDGAIKLFEKQTGIRVNLSEYDSNEALYAKLKAAPNAGYDVIIPSNYYIKRMVQEGMLRPLNHALLPNASQLNPALLNKSFDPHNRYTYPYTWGTTGIMLDRRFWNPKTVTKWSDLWQKRFRNQLLLYDDPGDVFGMSQIVLKYPMGTQQLNQIHHTYAKLTTLMPNVRLFSTDAAISAFADSDVTVGMAESGDVFVARQTNPYLVYIYPKDGVSMWEDCWAIPKYAPHFNNAMTFINFMMQAKIALYMVEGQGYASPNLRARKLLPKLYQHDPIMYPDSSIIRHAHMEAGFGKARSIYMHYWELLKLY